MKQDLQIERVWPTSDGGAVLSPFEASEDFTQECWQASEVIAASPADCFFSFLLEGHEVVRMLIEDPAGSLDGYDVAADPEDVVLIDFMEVAAGYRRQGYGSRAVELLKNRFPGRTIVAIPGGDEGFWTSLGWQRYEHIQGGEKPALFVSPRVTRVGSITGETLPL
ncbi:GNAT family N-acetyltransferase [Arthrobacter rhizosphaerae]|uniref:GNAT family N-acetyltransferase n=1 Tax=Arthrobacter rhizosphaerae TaxID=2855490 RepID=UPI001FF5097A|nr:GNAT family N-acetyltransferase [Arthrobacter rhizosphaerae]